MNFLKELFKYIIKRKKFFLIPALFILIVLGTLFVVSQGTTVAPLIYTLF
tara:strand:- start:200 stop:349 length:150 start_codon:yes stop_codon:yes gene_type:complete